MEEDILIKLNTYKELINFKNKMEKGNFKWIDQYVKKGIKKGQTEDLNYMLDTVISMQKDRIILVKEYRGR